MKRIIQDKLGLLFIPACVLFTAPAFGQSDECTSDDQCAEGQVCQKAMYVDACAAPPPIDAGDTQAEDTPACDSEPHEAETGYCSTLPTACTSNDDCEEYLSCVESGSTGCAVSSDGQSTCPEPQTETTKYCSLASVPCETNDECPRDFECVELSACPAIDCVSGDTECLDTCTGTGQKECQPKQIDCEDTSDCPSAWSCVGNVIENCSGGGGTIDAPSGGAVEPGSGSGTDTPAPDAGSGTGSEPAPDGGSDPVAPDGATGDPDTGKETCTREPAVGYCQPDAWGGDGRVYANDVLEVGGDDAGTTADPSAPPSEAESLSSGGGCSVARGGQPVDFAWVLSLLAALPLVRRRRSAA